MGIIDILKQYIDPSAPAPGNVGDHFDEVARQMTPAELGPAVAAAFRSNKTPSFGESVGSLFNQSNSQQQAGVLNQLIQSIGPGALTGIVGTLLSRILGSGAATGQISTVTPAQASQFSPADVSALATHAQNQNDSVVDKISGFYAQHPALVKSMGAAALAIALGHLHSSR